MNKWKYMIPALVIVALLSVAISNIGIRQLGASLIPERLSSGALHKESPEDHFAPNHSKRIRDLRNSPTTTTQSQSQDIVFAFTKHPFNAAGTNKFAIAHYSLGDDQVKALKLIADATRRRIAEAIAERLVEVGAPKDAERVFEFNASEELSSETEKMLYSDISAVAGTEFAEGAVEALQTDSRFLWGGRNNIRISINPKIMHEPNSMDYRKKGIIILQLQITNSMGKDVCSWEGRYESFKENTLIDLSL